MTKRALFRLSSIYVLLVLSACTRADIFDVQVNSSADYGQGYGYADTIGGNNVYNLYLSKDNGLSFVNSGDGANTAVDLPTNSPGSFTYSFFYSNAFAESLTLQLWFGARGTTQPGVVVSTHRDSDPTAFSAIFDPTTAPPFVYPTPGDLPPGSSHFIDGGFSVTLKEFAFTNGAGPADHYSVSPGASYTPEISGHFTYQVEPTLVPELPSVVLWGSGLVPLGLTFLLGRSKQSGKDSQDA